MDASARILVVSSDADDQHAQRDVLATAELEWELEFCDSGRAALAHIESWQPDCIVLDGCLADMTGIECFQAVKTLSVPGANPSVPVLMLIAQNDEAAVSAALRAGVQDYLFKDERGNYLAMLPAVLKRALRERHILEEKETAQAALSKLERRYEYLFLGVADGIIIADENRIIDSANPSACRIFGYDGAELTGQPLTMLMQPGHHVVIGHEFETYLKTGTGRFIGQGALEVEGLRKGGQVFTLEVSIDEIDFDGRRMFAAVLRDTTERHRARRLMQESEERFRNAFENAPIGMALISLDGHWLKVNQALCGILGYTHEELLQKSFQDVTHPDDLDIDQTFVQLLLADQLKSYQMETRYFHKDGRAVPIALSSSLARDGEGKPLYFMAKIEDITQRRKMEDALQAEKDLAQTALQSIGDAVITADADGRITYLNPMAERLTGWSNRDACGRPLDEVFVVVGEISRELAPNPGIKALKEGKICGLASDAVLIAKNGLEYCIDISASPIRIRDGSLTGVVVVFHDATEARSLSRRISYQASHDALTGLANRTEFELVVTRLLQTARSTHVRHALLYLDLDQFKTVNDTCGHLAGDELLRQLAHLLSGNLRKSDMLARLGGDEFGLLLEGCPQDRAVEIAEHLIDTVRGFRFEWEGKLFGVGMSVGLVVITDQSRDLQSVLKAADAACYLAKQKGRNCVEVYRQNAKVGRELQAQIDWMTRLQTAAAENRFLLHYQRIQPVADGRLPPHFEVLLRYRDEQDRLLLPMAFIPSADRYGLLPSIDRWVIRRLLRNPLPPPLDADPHSLIAINISGASLADDGFQDFLLEELRASRVPPGRLCVEIAEASAVSHLHRTIRLIEALKTLGCRCALDDFGGGMSSFGYLKLLPFDFLKISGAIVRGIAKDPVDCALVEAIHRVAKAMNIHSIAKFVESAEALPYLRRIGIDYAQGFALHEPEAMNTSGSS